MEPEFTPLSNAVWAQRVAAACALPDPRLNRRLSGILVDTLDQPAVSIPQATGGNAGQAKATYRFYDNGRVTGTQVNQGAGLETAARCLDPPVLRVIQDTTVLNFTGLHVMAELGPINGGSLARGMHVHNTLALTATGQMIGLLDQ